MNKIKTHKTIISLFLAVLLITGVYAQFVASGFYDSRETYNPDNYYAGYSTNYYDSRYSGYDSRYSGYDSRYSGYDSRYSGYDSRYGGYDSRYGGYYDPRSNYYNPFSHSTNYYQGSSPYSSGGFHSSSNWAQFPRGDVRISEQCDGETTDFFIAIPPGGCTPNVVRSDLLAEQNVPVFCKISALQLNPLIDVSAISSISITGEYPPGISGISYHPARQSLRSYNTILSGPVVDDPGYVVITLSRQPDERNLPDFIEGQLTARIRYDARHVFGMGNAEYYLGEGDEKVAFWNGKGYLEVEYIDNWNARINLYQQREAQPYRSFTLREGQTSGMVYFPGYYCSAGLSVRLNRIIAAEDMALLNIEGDQIWVRRGSRFLDNRCYVRDLRIFSRGTGEIDITCSGQNIQLRLSDKGVLLSSNEITREYTIGDEIISESNQKYYLSYYGTDPSGASFLILTKSRLSHGDLSYLNNHFTRKNWFRHSLEEFRASISNDPEGKSRIGEYNKDYFFMNSGESYDGIGFYELTAEQYFDDSYSVGSELKVSEEIVKELVELYPTEEKIEGVYWGEEALFEQIILTGKAGDVDKQSELIELFERKYPSSDYLFTLLEIKRKTGVYDYSNARATVRVNNDYFSIFLDGFREEREMDKSATIRVAGRSAEFVREGQTIKHGDGELIVERIEVNGILFRFNSNQGRTESRFISLNSFGMISGTQIEVRDIDTKRVAHVSVIPNIRMSYSEADFAFKIGIEKRNIQLNPERTAEAIKGLEQTIMMWEDMLEKLGNVIKVWKGVCFATSTIMMLQTMLGGFSGESLARKNVMTKYKTICDIEISKGTYATRTECYNAMSSKINNDVSRITNALNSVNTDLKRIQQGNIQKTGILGEEKIIDQDKYVNDLKNQLSWDGITIDGTKIEKKDLTKSTEISSIMLYQKLGCDVDEKSCTNDPSMDPACCFAYEDMRAQLKGASIQKRTDEETKRISDNIGAIAGGSTDPLIQTLTSDEVLTANWNGQTGKDFTNIPSEIKPDDRIQFLNLNGKTYLVKLRESTMGGSMGVLSAYLLNNARQWEKVTDLSQDGLDKIVFIGGSRDSCSGNLIKNPEVRYYESGRNKGLPAIVPFDVQNGWYVYVPNSYGSVFDRTTQSYTSAGDVHFFWICNAGRNGIIEMKSGDDLCQSFSVHQTNFDRFISCGLEGREVSQLYSRARDAITQAARAYGRKGSIDIAGNNMRIGTPLSDTGGVECQDFMSPENCKLLFNVCDPVICPASRCDLGGKYPVSDVVQTGIIGSIVLCLPNMREGVIFPVCLTGIHAGVDAFVSILKSQRDCLKENLETGRYVGICDEITAIYICEFFWRNFGSLLDVLMPTFLQNIFGSGTGARGGGEYLTTQTAWENVGKSMDFFTGFYAENAMTAFRLRSAENIGIDICRGFLGTSVPFGFSAENKATFDALLSPQSPAQFYAHFSEIPFSDATSPPISHYKVYYHIYAGNDFGGSYNVYLRSPPLSGYYAIMPTVNVRTGYIARGERADESIDFTAPSGYKELCVRINNQEHCGFGTVSSDFAITYATQKYVEDQAKKTQITTQEECLSTSSSTWALISPNIQAGMETAIGGRDINLAGITRICATQNPGVEFISKKESFVCETDNDCYQGYSCRKLEGSKFGNCVNLYGDSQLAQGGWVDVGYCDNPNIRCWLDTSTLKDRFRAIDAINQEIYGKQGTVIDALRYNEMYGEIRQDYQRARAILTEQYNRIRRLTPDQLRAGDRNYEITDILVKLTEVSGDYISGIGTTNNQAEALALKATVYRMIIEQKIKDKSDYFVKGPTIIEEPEIIDKPIVSEPVTKEEFNIVNQNNRNYISYQTQISIFYIQSDLILKETQGSPEIVGRITENNLIIINREQQARIGPAYLGDLDGIYYSKERGFYE